jgi:hypothetical protein
LTAPVSSLTFFAFGALGITKKVIVCFLMCTSQFFDIFCFRRAINTKISIFKYCTSTFLYWNCVQRARSPLDGFRLCIFDCTSLFFDIFWRLAHLE